MKKITMLATILLVQPVLASHNTEAIRAQEIPVARVADTANVAEVAPVAKVARVAKVAEVADIAAVAEIAAVAPTKDCLTAKDLLPAGIGVLIGFVWLGIMIFRQPLGRL